MVRQEETASASNTRRPRKPDLGENNKCRHKEILIPPIGWKEGSKRNGTTKAKLSKVLNL